MSQPDFAPGLPGVAARLLREEGVIAGFYSGFGRNIPKKTAQLGVVSFRGSDCHVGPWTARHGTARSPSNQFMKLDLDQAQHEGAAAVPSCSERK